MKDLLLCDQKCTKISILFDFFGFFSVFYCTYNFSKFQLYPFSFLIISTQYSIIFFSRLSILPKTPSFLKFPILMIKVFSGNTSRISNIRRGAQSPMFDDTELTNINFNLGVTSNRNSIQNRPKPKMSPDVVSSNNNRNSIKSRKGVASPISSN